MRMAGNRTDHRVARYQRKHRHRWKRNHLAAQFDRRARAFAILTATGGNPAVSRLGFRNGSGGAIMRRSGGRMNHNGRQMVRKRRQPSWLIRGRLLLAKRCAAGWAVLVGRGCCP